jgi:hypothetical protein
MPRSHLLDGLIKLHARIEGCMIGKRDRSHDSKNVGRLAHVCVVIRMVEPEFDFRRIKPRKSYGTNPWFKRGEGLLTAIEVLREATKPLTMREIVLGILAKRRVTDFSREQLLVLTNTIRITLTRKKGKPLIAHGDKPRRWSVKP